MQIPPNRGGVLEVVAVNVVLQLEVRGVRNPTLVQCLVTGGFVAKTVERTPAHPQNLIPFVLKILCPDIPGTIGGKGTGGCRPRFWEEEAAKYTRVVATRAEAAAPVVAVKRGGGVELPDIKESCPPKTGPGPDELALV